MRQDPQNVIKKGCFGLFNLNHGDNERVDR